MSKTLFTFLLSELNTMRILCRKDNCRAVFEMSLEDLWRHRPTQCPFCRSDWDDRGDIGPLAKLAEAIANMKRYDKMVGVEFVLSQDPTVAQ